MSERVDIVDASDRVVGQASRAAVRRENLLHRAVYVVVRNSEGLVYVHRRTTTKDVYPGYDDVTVGGVVAAGEDYATAARRELAEELGITDATLEVLGPIRYEDAHTRLLGVAYLAVHDGPIVPQREEIASGGLVSLAEARRIAAAPSCCPDGAQVLLRYVDR